MAAPSPGSAGYQGTRAWFRQVAIEIGQFLQNLAGTPITITSATSLDILQVNSSGTLVNRQPLGAETNTTPVAGANDTVIGANTWRLSFFTMPTTAPWFQVTGIEWLNGTVVNGNTNSAIYYVDANPPVSNNVVLAAWAVQVAQTGASGVQRVSTIGGGRLPAGAICGALISTASATGRYGTTTVANANNSKSIASSSDYTTGNTTAWAATTEEPYIKVYYQPVLGV